MVLNLVAFTFYLPFSLSFIKAYGLVATQLIRDEASFVSYFMVDITFNPMLLMAIFTKDFTYN